jgi:hypothetical protein
VAQDKMDAELESQLAVGDRAWAALCAVLDASEPDRPLHDPDSPDWTSRDIYTHFIRMHEGSANAIRSELARQAVDWEAEDTPQRIQAMERRNDARVEKDRRYSFDDAQARAQAARDAYRELICSLTVDQWRAFGRKHSDDLLGGHYEGHLRYIQGAS